MRARFAAVLVAGFLLSASALAGPSLSLSTKASLQAAMQRHIDRALVGGVLLHLDDETGQVRPLRPMAAHPEILQMGEFFVLCADFRAANGDKVNVDFFLVPEGKRFVVFSQQVENHALLARLMRSGRAKRVD